MKNWLFFMIGWIGGTVMATVDGLPNKLIVTGIVVLVYIVASLASGLTMRAADVGTRR